MIKHIVFWKLKEEALGHDKATNALLIKEKLEALNGQIEGLIKAEVGIDFEGSDMAADVALYTEFASKEDLAFYQQHPKHKAVQAFVGEVRLARQVVDYEV
ncbi:MAG: Dabb family protein [Bacteroidales bacterium]|nr:Dabb family protein [Bacteroidales bacterium]